MTDFRDTHRTAYGQTDPNRFNDLYASRTGGSTGILIAIGVVALLIVAALLFGGGEPTTTVSSDGGVQITPSTPVMPAPAPDTAPGTAPAPQ